VEDANVASEAVKAKTNARISTMITERIVWSGRRGQTPINCALRGTCVGVDLLVVEGDKVIRQERHADRSTAGERARDLYLEFQQLGYVIVES
jgi:hypothetical protein